MQVEKNYLIFKVAYALTFPFKIIMIMIVKEIKILGLENNTQSVCVIMQCIPVCRCQGWLCLCMCGSGWWNCFHCFFFSVPQSSGGGFNGAASSSWERWPKQIDVWLGGICRNLPELILDLTDTYHVQIRLPKSHNPWAKSFWSCTCSVLLDLL